MFVETILRIMDLFQFVTFGKFLFYRRWFWEIIVFLINVESAIQFFNERKEMFQILSQYSATVRVKIMLKLNNLC